MKPPTDLRRYRRRTETAFAIAVALMLLIGGSVTVGLVYGWPAAASALLCLLPGAGAFLLLWLVLWGLDYLSRWGE